MSWSVLSTSAIPLFSNIHLTASGIPPETMYLRYSVFSLFNIISGRRTTPSKSSTYCQSCTSLALKNSLNDTGYILSIVTLPTGTVMRRLFTATPNSEPAAMTWYWGASSQKYFKLLKASSHSWISSKIISVLPAMIGTSVYNASSLTMRSGDFVWRNTDFSSSCRSKSNLAQ